MTNTCSEMSITTYFLACVFGIGAWVAINGLFVELAVVVPHLPEGWSLPSYLIVVIQIANIGPVMYVLGNKFFPNIIREVPAIYVMLSVGIVACGLLGFLWRETTYVAGAQHSTAFLTLAFFLAMVDTTSSVSFIPFMSVFREFYLSPYFVGEGLSGLLPSLVAMAQGVGKGASHSLCGVEPSNSTSNSTWSGGPQPQFSPNAFFFFLCAMTAVCLLAFVGLNYLPVAKRQYAKHSSYNLETQETCKITEETKDKLNAIELAFYVPGRDEGEVNEKSNGTAHKVCSAEIQHNKAEEVGVHFSEIKPATQKNPPNSHDSELIGHVTVYLLVTLGIVNGLSNGVVPALMSYACIPYSYYVYHLTLTLSSIANPVVCFLFVFIRTKSPPIIAFLSFIYLGLCVYIIIVAKQSPEVLLRCDKAGSILIVSINRYTIAQTIINPCCLK